MNAFKLLMLLMPHFASGDFWESKHGCAFNFISATEASTLVFVQTPFFF